MKRFAKISLTAAALMAGSAIAYDFSPVGRVHVQSASEEAAEAEAAAVAAGAAPKAADPVALYTTTCSACHATGAAGAPKLGDKGAWTARIASGMDGLVSAAINGKGVMPPKGGNANLSDDDIRLIVEYMVEQSS